MKMIIAASSILVLLSLFGAWRTMGDRKREDDPEEPSGSSQEKADAAAEIDRKCILRDHNAELLDAIEEELEQSSGKRKTALLRQRVTVEQKIFALERQIEKLYQTIYGVD